jgi:hypothetical protein
VRSSLAADAPDAAVGAAVVIAEGTVAPVPRGARVAFRQAFLAGSSVAPQAGGAGDEERTVEARVSERAPLDLARPVDAVGIDAVVGGVASIADGRVRQAAPILATVIRADEDAREATVAGAVISTRVPSHPEKYAHGGRRRRRIVGRAEEPALTVVVLAARAAERRSHVARVASIIAARVLNTRVVAGLSGRNTGAEENAEEEKSSASHPGSLAARVGTAAGRGRTAPPRASAERIARDSSPALKLVAKLLFRWNSTGVDASGRRRVRGLGLIETEEVDADEEHRRCRVASARVAGGELVLFDDHEPAAELGDDGPKARFEHRRVGAAGACQKLEAVVGR